MDQVAQQTEPADDVTPPATGLPPEPPVETPMATGETASPVPAPAGDAPPAVNPKSPKWALDRISSESAKRQEAERRAQEAERRAQEAEALASRLQQGKDTLPPAPPLRPSIPADIPQDRIDRAASQQIFARDVGELNVAGQKQFGQAFNEHVNILAAVAPSQEQFFEFVADIISVDKGKAHEIINELGSDGERAALIAAMPSKQRIAEITRMTMAAAAPKTETPTPAPPAKVSKAPAPPPPVTPSASKEIDWRSDEASDADFSKGWDSMMKNRRVRR